jgi:hypothetical protein
MNEKLNDDIFYYDRALNRYNTPFEAWHSFFHESIVGNERFEYKFYYYDHILKDVAWNIEPTKTLKQLYKERAQEIRDNYEYVIVCYSGGNDSSNVLESFYYNNIHIDEIVLVGSFSQDESKEIDLNHNKDLYVNAFPLLKTLHLPNTKITTIDYTELFRDIDQFSLVKKYGNDYFPHIGTHKSPHNLFWHDFRQIVGKDNNKKTARVMGAEKVDVGYDFITSTKAVGAHVYFKDNTINSYGMSHIDENFERVNFYNDPRSTVCIDILKKQAHIVHNLIKLKIANGDPLAEIEAVFNNRFVLNKLFYDLKTPLVYQSPKSKNYFFSVRDTFLTEKQDSEIFKIHKANIERRVDYFRQNVTFLSRKYYIE